MRRGILAVEEITLDPVVNSAAEESVTPEALAEQQRAACTLFDENTLALKDDQVALDRHFDALEEAEGTVDTLEAISDAAKEANGEMSHHAMEALQIAVNHLCARIGFAPGDKRIPALEDMAEKAPEGGNKFVAMIKRIVEAIKAAIVKAYETIKGIVQKLFGREKSVEMKAKATVAKVKELHGRLDGRALQEAWAALMGEQQELGIHAEELVVEEITDLDKKLTEGLEHKVPLIRSHKLAHFFRSHGKGSKSNWNTLIADLGLLSTIEDKILDDLKGYSAWIGEFNPGGTDMAQLVSNLLDDVAKSLRNYHFAALNGEAFVDYKVTGNINVLIMRMPYDCYFEVGVNSNTGHMSSAARKYESEGDSTGLVQPCPFENIDHACSLLTEKLHAAVHGTEKLRLFNEDISQKLAARITKLEGFKNQGNSELQESLAHYRAGANATQGLMNFMNQLIAYRQTLNSMLFDWISESTSLAGSFAAQPEKLAA